MTDENQVAGSGYMDRARLPASLTSADIHDVFGSINKRINKRQIPFTKPPEISLRLDLGRGINNAAFETISSANQLNLRPSILFPLCAGGELGYAREGQFFLDPTAVEQLKQLSLSADEIGFLADPVWMVERVLNSPLNLWTAAMDELSEAGLEITSLGYSPREDDISALNLIWISRCFGFNEIQSTGEVLDTIDYQSREWTYERAAESNPLRLMLDKCFFPTSCYLGEKLRGRFLNALQVSLKYRVHLNLSHTCDLFVHTDSNGWTLIRDDGVRTSITTRELITKIKDLPRNAIAQVIVDPQDISSATPQSLSDGPIRTLPYPHEYYLSINSDVDWTTYHNQDQINSIMCDKIGLGSTNSAYLTSRDPNWPSWQNLSKQSLVQRFGAWAASGHFDTVHGLAHSHDPVILADYISMSKTDENTTIDQSFDFDPVDTLILHHTSISSMAEAPQLALDLGQGQHCELNSIRTFIDDREGRTYHCYSLNTVFSKFNITNAKRLTCHQITIGPTSMNIADAHLVRLFGTTLDAERTLEQMSSLNFHPPIFSQHGGGEYPGTYGMWGTQEWAESMPEQARFAIDNPNTPFYIFPALRRAGVAFFNGPYNFSAAKFFPIHDLIEPASALDGTPIYLFCRYYSFPTRGEDNGFSEQYTYGKHAATSQGLGAVVEDILQHFHWQSSGQGAIIYTHLGHKVGNQINSDISWNVETLSAMKRLATYARGGSSDCPTPFSVWVAPSALVLTYAAVVRQLSSHLTITGNNIIISSWMDENLGCRIPDPVRFGSGWLHGVTLYVDDPHNVNVTVDGEPMNFFTANPPEGNHSASITFVDNRHQLQLLHSPQSASNTDLKKSGVELSVDATDASTTLTVVERQNRSDEGIRINPISLRNMTHITLEVSSKSNIESFNFGFMTSEEEWFDIKLETLPSDRDQEWHRHTYSLETLGDYRPPRGDVIAIRIDADLDTALRDISLLRPKAGQHSLPLTCTLAGSIQTLTGAQSMNGCVVECHFELEGRNQLIETEVLDGAYIFHNIPQGKRCRLILKGPEQTHIGYGDTVHLTCDHWDWNITMAPEVG